MDPIDDIRGYCASAVLATVDPPRNITFPPPGEPSRASKLQTEAHPGRCLVFIDKLNPVFFKNAVLECAPQSSLMEPYYLYRYVQSKNISRMHLSHHHLSRISGKQRFQRQSPSIFPILLCRPSKPGTVSCTSAMLPGIRPLLPWSGS